MKIRNLIVSLVATLGAGALTALTTAGEMTIYGALHTPVASAPGWLFPVVWTALYTLMAISVYRISVSDSVSSGERVVAVSLYILQLAVNILWPAFFFTRRLFFFSAVWILLLLALVIVMFVRFLKIDKTAARLNIPYIIWLVYAAYLNFGIAFLN